MRPSRHQMFMAMARVASTRATCFRLNVGAALVDRDRRNVVSVGYNGAPTGVGHCTGNGCPHMTPVGCKVVHAERNALDRAGDWRAAQLTKVVVALGGSVIGVRASLRADLYVTHSPCLDCARGAVDFGVSTVYFEAAYRDPTPIDYLRRCDVAVIQLLPSGLGVDADGDLVELT